MDFGKEVQDLSGSLCSGQARRVCTESTADFTEAPVLWRGNVDLAFQKVESL